MIEAEGAVSASDDTARRNGVARVAGFDGDSGERGLGEPVAGGAFDDAILREGGRSGEDQSEREMISRNSSSVRTMGLPFILLACAALSTRTGRSAGVTP